MKLRRLAWIGAAGLLGLAAPISISTPLTLVVRGGSSADGRVPR